MTVRRPLVRVGGRTRQLADNEQIPASAVTGRGAIRLYDASNALHYLTLDENLELPITLSDGRQGSVPTLGVLYD